MTNNQTSLTSSRPLSSIILNNKKKMKKPKKAIKPKKKKAIKPKKGMKKKIHNTN